MTAKAVSSHGNGGSKPTTYHWSDKAPHPDDFFGKEDTIDIEFPSSEDALRVLEEINKEGEKHMTNEEYVEALWKYLYSKRICTKYNISGRVSWKACDGIMAAAVEASWTVTSHKHFLNYVNENFKFITEQQDIEQDFLVRVHYKHAQCYLLRSQYLYFRLKQYHEECRLAIGDLIQCHHLQMNEFISEPDTKYLTEAITQVVEWNYHRESDYRAVFNSVHSSTSLFIKLLEKTLTSSSTRYAHLDLLFTTHVKDQRPEDSGCLDISKEKAVSLLKDLIKQCSEKLSFSHEEVVSLISRFFKYFNSSEPNGEALRQHLVDAYASKVPRQQLLPLSKCLNTNHRTELVLKKLSEKMWKDVTAVLEGGDVNPKEIDLFKLISVDELLDMADTKLLESLLEHQVDPTRTAKRQKSPISQLTTKLKNSNSMPLERKQKIVGVMVLLLRHGCSAEDLCNLYDGTRTTPVHIATELCLATGNTELLSTVVFIFKQSASPHIKLLDQNNETPIFILSRRNFSSLDEQLIHKTCDILINGAGICLEHKDMYGRTILDILPNKDSRDFRHTVIEKFRVQAKVAQSAPDVKPSKSTDKRLKEDDSNTSTVPQKVESVEEKFARMFGSVMEKEDSYFLKPESSTENLKSEKVPHVSKASDHHSTDEKQATSNPAVGPPPEQKPTEQAPPQLAAEIAASSNEINFKGLIWEVRCSDKVKDFLKDSRYPLWLRERAAGKIKEIASGDWNLYRKKQVSKIAGLYEARFTQACRIIWGIKSMVSERMTEELNKMLKKHTLKEHKHEEYPVKSEMIVIAAIVVDHDKIHHNVKVVEKSFGTYMLKDFEGMFVPLGKQERQGRQTERLPQHFIQQKHMDIKEVREAAERLNCSSKEFEDAEMVERNKRCMKFYSLSTQRILSLLYGEYERRDYPIEPSEEEYEIISIPDNQAILLLGRSGTGKTTCCLCRIWNKFKGYWSVNDRINVPEFKIPVNSSKICIEGTQAISDKPSCTEPLNVNNYERMEHQHQAVATTPEKCSDKNLTYMHTLSQFSNTESSMTESTSECTDTSLEIKSDVELDFQSNDPNQSFYEESASEPSHSATHALNEDAEEEVKSKSQSSDKKFEHLHQVFIAKNFIFCQQMRKLFYDFIAGDSSIVTEHMSHEDNDLPSTLSDINDLSYPLFLPARKFFLLLDQSLGDGQEFFKTIDSSDYYHDNEETLEDLLYFKYSLIDDENDGIIMGAQTDTPENTGGREKRKYIEVTASYFAKNLWPTLRRKHVDSKTDPLLVWTEIKSFIKGSFEALNSPDGYISESEYMKIGAKRAPFFVGDRKAVYTVFKEYQNIRHRNIQPLYDECDFIFNLYKRLNTLLADRCLPWSIHRLYVDEVQDFTQAELAILLQCCRDPKGFFLTGDTAQSIVRGIAFRFEDLKSIFQDMKTKFHNVEVPKLHYVTRNHRSHLGITELASSVTDLLQEYFPFSFDHHNVPKDKAEFYGETPLFLCSLRAKESLELLLSENDHEKENPKVELGTEQAVIVRSQDSKQSLPNFIKDSEISLTVEESKGLEFDDVIVYNFFTELEAQDSELWRAAITYLDRHPSKRVTKATLKHIHPLTFNPTYHKSLSYELKLLYTVITRAKYKLVFYESGEQEKYLPIVSYWVARSIIHKVESPDAIPKSFLSTARSTEGDWKKKGDEYSQKRLWLQASRCYQKAKQPLLEHKTMALFHISEAERAQKQEQTEHFTQAAIEFFQCDEIEHDVRFLSDAATCLYRAQRLEEAAKLFERMKKLEELFYVYKAKKDDKKCVKIKVQMRDYRGAIMYLLSIRKYDAAVQKAVRFVNQHDLDIQGHPFPELTTIAHTSAQRCIQLKKYDSLREILTLLPSLPQRVDFLKQAQLFTDAYKELVSGKQYEAAFRLCRARGLWQEAIELAKVCDKKTMLDSLVLQEATSLLVVRRKLSGKEMIRLQNLSKHKDLETRAHALLLQAKSCLQRRKVPESYRYCKQALQVYTEIKETLSVGRFEAFNLFIIYEEHHLITPLEYTEMAVQKSLEAKNVVEIIQSIDISSLFNRLGHVLQFYGLEKLGQVFCLPYKQDLWITTLDKCRSAGISSNDSDGMLQLEPSTTVLKIRTHLRELVATWLNHAQNIMYKKLDQFPFHRQLLQNPYTVHSWPQNLDCLMEYFHVCNAGLSLCEVGRSCFDAQQMIKSIVKMFSPLLFLSLPMKIEQMRPLKDITPLIYKHIQQEVEYVSKTTRSNLVNRNFEFIFNSSRWLEVWRLMGIFRFGHDQLESVLTEMESIVAKQPPVSRNNPLPFDYIQLQRGPTHYFRVWVRACEVIQNGDVLSAIKDLVLPCFVSTIAKRSSLGMHVDDLVNIFSIFSLAAFSLLAANTIKERRTTTFFIPQTFVHMVENFDGLNCQKSDDKTLLEACSSTVSNKFFKNQEVHDCLWNMLHILLGIFHKPFAVLHHSVEKGFYTEATHCLVLVLTILGNMSFITTKDQIYRYQNAILQQLKPLVVNSGASPALKSLQQVYISFAKCTGTQDIFRNILQLLRSLTAADGAIVELKATVDPALKIQFSFTDCSPDSIPYRQLNRLTDDFIIESTVKKLAKHLSQAGSWPAPKQQSSANDVAQAHASAEPQPTSRESVEQEPLPESKVQHDFDLFDIDPKGSTKTKYSHTCYVCRKYDDSEDIVAHSVRADHIQNEKDFESFNSEFKWQYQSCLTSLHEKIFSTSTNISHEHHKLIIQANEMIKENDRKIEHVRDTRNWVDGLKLLQELTDEADELIRLIGEHEKDHNPLDSSEDNIDTGLPTILDDTDQKVMMLNVQHQQIAEQDPSVQQTKSAANQPRGRRTNYKEYKNRRQHMYIQ